MARSSSKSQVASSRGVMSYDEEMANFAKEHAQAESRSAGGAFISTRGGRFSFNGGEIPGGKFNAVIIDSVFSNAYYKNAFNPDAPESPVCYAFATKEDELRPHAESEEAQCESCLDCPWNKFGSAGRGKACKNQRRVALVTESELSDPQAQIALLNVPVTSCKAWAGYVQQIANTLRRPSFGVVTEVSIAPDPSTQFKLSFRYIRELTAKEIPVIMGRREEAHGQATLPYPKNSEQEEAPAPRGRGRSATATKKEAPAPSKFTRGRK